MRKLTGNNDEVVEASITRDFTAHDLQTQEALIREVWNHVDSATKKALATKFAQRLFEAAEKSTALDNEAREIVASITAKMAVPQDIKDSIEGRIRDRMPALVASEVETTVRAIAQEVASNIKGRIRGY